MNTKSSEVAERPKCKCGVYMEIRTGNGGGATPEQKFCGTWYDHPPVAGGSTFGHHASTLLPSPALLEQLGGAA